MGASMKYAVQIAALAMLLSGCATAPKDFYADPSKPKDTTLCRTFLETQDLKYKADIGTELGRRGLSIEECQNRVNMETAAVVGIAAVATGVAVIAACQNGGCAGGGYSAPSDVDCYGGLGNGPRWQYGPIWVGSYDPYNLDADGDGMGCEARDLGRGA